MVLTEASSVAMFFDLWVPGTIFECSMAKENVDDSVAKPVYKTKQCKLHSFPTRLSPGLIDLLKVCPVF